MDNFSKTYWRAIHTDKTIESSHHSESYHPYTEVRRDNLLSLIFYKKEKGKEITLKEFKRPDQSKWTIRWRLRNVIDEGTSKLKDRFWIVDDEINISLIRGNEKPQEFKSYEEADRKPITRTPLDIL